MKVKTPKDGPIERLYEAVQDIVQGVRGAISKTQVGGQNASLHIPVHFAGTDMRVTIEAGAGIAALNAIQGAEMKASGKPAADWTSAITEAMLLLALHAAELRQDNLELQDVHPQGAEWTDEQDRQTFENILRVVRDLESLKARLKALAEEQVKGGES